MSFTSPRSPLSPAAPWPASEPATPAAELETCLRLLNSGYIRGHEKRAGIAWITGRPDRVRTLTARTQALIDERAASPDSLENWAGRQRLARAELGTTDTSAPSHFNTRRSYANR